MADLESSIRNFIAETLLFGNDSGLDDDTPFLADQIIDLTGF